MTAREAAFLSLQRLWRDGKYSNLELSASIEKYKLTGVEKSLYTALLYGVIERKLTLDHLLGKYSSRPTEEIDKDVKTAIYLGLYQLYFTDKIPPSAAVNESVALLRRFWAKKNSEGFANAILRAAAKDAKNIDYPDKTKDPEKYLSVKYSVPAWLCREFIAEFSFDEAEAALEYSLSHPKATLAVNTLRITRDELMQKLIAEGIPCEKTKYSEKGIVLLENTPYEKLSAYDDLFFVQDEASQICCEALGAEAGESILDACACPGGKSFFSAIRMENRGQVLSCDLHESKLSLVSSGAERLGISIIGTRTQNSSLPFGEGEEFDRVLCDVPCSGFGVIAKKPELRYKTQEDIAPLPPLQYKILSSCARHVKTGGTLVYSTCTVLSAENSRVTEKFLEEHADFSLEPFSVGEIKSDGSLTLLPGKYGTDGFFTAKFRRNK